MSYSECYFEKSYFQAFFQANWIIISEKRAQDFLGGVGNVLTSLINIQFGELIQYTCGIATEDQHGRLCLCDITQWHHAVIFNFAEQSALVSCPGRPSPSPQHLCHSIALFSFLFLYYQAVKMRVTNFVCTWKISLKTKQKYGDASKVVFFLKW